MKFFSETDCISQVEIRRDITYLTTATLAIQSTQDLPVDAAWHHRVMLLYFGCNVRF